MSDEQPGNETPIEAASPSLRREALLPSERNRGFGTVAVVCTMAGVASGLALATTLMAMQVADSMSARNCPTFVRASAIEVIPASDAHGFLGIRYVFRDGNAIVDSVLPNTPAQAIGLQRGDRVLAVDGEMIDTANELQERIYGARPGYRPMLEIKRDGAVRAMMPTLIAWPTAHTMY